MFRALLWKEWRELWVLPVAAALLAAMSFLLTKATESVARGIAPVVWEAGFALWLFLAALYIPTHLYARETDLRTSEFLRARPLDRFRLWWTKLSIGIAGMAAIGLILAAVIMLLKLFYATDHDFHYHGSYIIRNSMFAAAILFSLSSFFSSLFRKQLSSIAAVVLTLVFLGAVLFMLSMASIYDVYPVNKVIRFSPEYEPNSAFSLLQRYYYPVRGNYLSMLALILCPILLLLSLVIFAKGSLKNLSRRRIAITYSLLALLALSSTALGLSRLSVTAEPLTWQSSDRIGPVEVSPDGTCILVRTGQRWLRGTRAHWSDRSIPGSAIAGPLVSINLAERRIGIIETDRGYYQIYWRFHHIKGNKTILYDEPKKGWKRVLPQKVILSSLDGTWEKVLFTGNWFDFEDRKTSYSTRWSVDGKYIGVSAFTGEDRYNAILDADGNTLWKQTIPASEEAPPTIRGWDRDSRLYMVSVSGEPRWKSEVIRVGRDDFIPEEVPALSGEGRYPILFSPDGRWILNRHVTDSYKRYEYWVYDTEQGTSRFVAENASYPSWSPDGNFLAHVVTTDPPLGVTKTSERTWFGTLFIYETETGESYPISAESLPHLYIQGWSPSGEYLLFSHFRYLIQNINGVETPTPGGPAKLKVFSLTTRQITEVSNSDEKWSYGPNWVAGDRLMWGDKNRLMAAAYDGSNSEEIFRVEDDTFYLYGEEQS